MFPLELHDGATSNPIVWLKYLSSHRHKNLYSAVSLFHVELFDIWIDKELFKIIIESPTRSECWMAISSTFNHIGVDSDPAGLVGNAGGVFEPKIER